MAIQLSKWQRRGVIAAGVFAAWLIFTVDDWGRDFVRNTATISSEDHSAVQRLLAGRSPEEVAAAIVQAARRVPSYGPAQRADSDGTIRLAFVRKSKVFRFRDDVVMTITREGGRLVVRGESASRVGKGDLGQNPRNLDMLLAEMAVVLDRPNQSAERPVLRPPRSLLAGEP